MRRKRGIALITVLIISGLLMILIGSFMQINQRHFGLLNNDLHHVAVTQGARSAFDYCLFKLERQRQWGVTPFNGERDPQVNGYLQVKSVEGTRRVTGKVLESGAEFEVDILNNIDGSASLDGVAVGYCRLRITCERGSSKVTREAMLGTAPLFDGAVIASENIYVDANHLTVSSTDPLRNRLRSKGRITVPDYVNNFNFASPADASERGILWAEGGIRMGGKDLSDPDVLQQATQATGGQFLPQADTHYDVYDLQMNEVRSSKHSVSVDSGVYVFGRRQVAYSGDTGEEYATVPVLERRDWALDDDGNLVNGDVREVWYMPSSLPDDAMSEGIELWGDLPENGLHVVRDNDFHLDAGVHVHFNSLDPTYTGSAQPPSIVLNSDVNLNVQGDFGITSMDRDYNPTIMFRDPDTGEVNSDSSGNVVSGSITAQAANGKPGSIFIEGFISGNGKLLAEGDVTLRNTYANVESDEQSDLSIFAGGNVTVRPQKARALDDQTIFEGANENADGTTAFRGLVYAGEDVLFEADKNIDANIEERADLYIEGAVVARNGSVRVRKANNVNFRYNPEYVDTILNPSRESRVRLERVVWKEN